MIDFTRVFNFAIFVIHKKIYFKNKFRSAKFIFIIRGMSFFKKKYDYTISFFFRQREPIVILKSAKKLMVVDLKSFVEKAF